MIRIGLRRRTRQRRQTAVTAETAAIREMTRCLTVITALPPTLHTVHTFLCTYARTYVPLAHVRSYCSYLHIFLPSPIAMTVGTSSLTVTAALGEDKTRHHIIMSSYYHIIIFFYHNITLSYFLFPHYYNIILSICKIRVGARTPSTRMVWTGRTRSE